MIKEKLEEKIIDAICSNDLVYFLQNRDKFNIDYRLKSENNDTLLLYSISDAESNIYRYFIENGANLQALNNVGENLLHSAIYSGLKERVFEIIDKVDIDKQSIDGTTPLLLAIGLEKEEIANHLIEVGVDINCQDQDGNRPIHLASYFGLFSVVKKLVDKGVEINVKTSKGNLPLALAVNEGHTEVVKLLYKLMYT